MNKPLFSVALGALLFTSFEFSASGTESGISNRIIGGEAANPSQWPYMVALTKRNGSSAFCGGSFIGERYVLTAAHCVDKKDPATLDVIVGAFNMDNINAAERIQVKQIYVHDSYTYAQAGNDIAVLVLEHIPVLNQSSQIALSDDFDELSKDDPLTVIGFGARNAKTGDYPKILHQVNVPFMPIEECRTKGGSYTTQGNNVFCAGVAGKDSCDGDSGGPIFFQTNNGIRQMGVVSWGSSCAEANKPGVYTKLSAFTDWLADQRLGLSYRQKQDLGIVRAGRDSQKFIFTNTSLNTFNLTNLIVTGSTGTQIGTINNTCPITLGANDSCYVDVEYEVTTLTQGHIKLSFDSSSVTSGHVYAWRYFDALAAAPAAIVNLLTNLPTHNIHVNDHAWAVQSDSLQTPTLQQGQESVLVLDNLPKGRLKFNYQVVSNSVHDTADVYVNGKLKKTYYNGWNGSEVLSMYEDTNKVRIVYRRSYFSDDTQSKAILNQFSYDSQLLDSLPPIDTRSNGGGGSLGGAILTVLFACGWLRRRKTL